MTFYKFIFFNRPFKVETVDEGFQSGSIFFVKDTIVYDVVRRFVACSADALRGVNEVELVKLTVDIAMSADKLTHVMVDMQRQKQPCVDVANESVDLLFFDTSRTSVLLLKFGFS